MRVAVSADGDSDARCDGTRDGTVQFVVCVNNSARSACGARGGARGGDMPARSGIQAAVPNALSRHPRWSLCGVSLEAAWAGPTSTENLVPWEQIRARGSVSGTIRFCILKDMVR